MTAPDPGLQAQRTSLSWTRTSFAVLGNGALLMLHDIQDHRAGFGLAAAAVAVVIALLVYLVGVRRQRTLARHPLPRNVRPVREVHVVTIGVLVLIVVSVFSLPL
ncbi:DUF202 domain-containing protein [Mycobacterium sp. 21AC1]|uniref:DUF202 domain-containing protein n=1 Tax=[Mycobacterium] appelbergii TaxID=2939269 RepID=UPI0029394061|nr:DUF202 domain-containing protein [Mycobacterium sp. 21AC1]MDV3127106.1 DUF202 domain-containing protein [Mycobacterium sp. 21AC1]